MLEYYDDEHLAYLHAYCVLAGIGEDNRRAGRICAAVDTAVKNGLRLAGHQVKDSSYHGEDAYLPEFNKPLKVKRQSWDEMRQALGF